MKQKILYRGIPSTYVCYIILTSYVYRQAHIVLYNLHTTYLCVTVAMDQDFVAFGGLQFNYYIQGQINVNSLDNNTTAICYLSSCLICTPILVDINSTERLVADTLYVAESGRLAASMMLNDSRTQSTDYNLVLMFNPQANHSFVYYAVSVDFVGDHLQSVHSNDHSTFIVIGLTDNTEVRISPNRNVVINGASIIYGEEYVLQLNRGQNLSVSSSEDLTGSRVTSNKATLFYSGHTCAANNNDNCSILVEQIPPYNSWGNSFFLHTNVSGLVGNMFKFVASDAGANVSVNCTSDGIAYETRSFYLGFRQALSLSLIDSYCAINSDENILIIQFQESNHELPRDTFMTVVPAVTHYSDTYVFNTYGNSIVSLVVRERNPRSIPLLLNDVQVSGPTWEEVVLDEITYFFGAIALPLGRNRLNLDLMLVMTIEFGAVIYGFSEMDTFALPAGMKLDLIMNLPTQGNCVIMI